MRCHQSFRGDAYSLIFGKRIFFPKAGSGTDHFHYVILWGGKHIRGKGISFQQFQGALCGYLAENLEVCRERHFKFRIELKDNSGLQVFKIVIVPDKVAEVGYAIIGDDGYLKKRIQLYSGSLF